LIGTLITLFQWVIPTSSANSLNLPPSQLQPANSIITGNIKQQTFICNVPYKRNPFFTDREDVLRQLHDTFNTDQNGILTRLQVIKGLAGIGKTQIAIEFANRYQNDYQYELWIKANSYEIFLSDFASLAQLLNLPEKDDKDQISVALAVKQWLDNNSHWLLIIDDADDLPKTYKFLPSNAKGHILITTHMQATGPIIQNIELANMEPEEGALLLLRRAKVLQEDAIIDNASVEDFNLAKEISQILDGLPLALDQAGAYIEETSGCLPDYLYLYNTHRRNLLENRGELAFDHPESVTSTFSIAYERVRQENSVAASLLKLCAFFSPEAIPEEIFTQTITNDNTELQSLEGNLYELNQTIKILLKFSLLYRDAEAHTLAVHHLVQTVIKDGMSEEAQQEWGKFAVQRINQSFPLVTETNWPVCQRYLSHALVCIEYIEQWSLDFPDARQLLLT
jgi:hypothetical protein